MMKPNLLVYSYTLINFREFVYQTIKPTPLYKFKQFIEKSYNVVKGSGVYVDGLLSFLVPHKDPCCTFRVYLNVCKLGFLNTPAILPEYKVQLDENDPPEHFRYFLENSHLNRILTKQILKGNQSEIKYRHYYIFEEDANLDDGYLGCYSINENFISYQRFFTPIENHFKNAQYVAENPTRFLTSSVPRVRSKVKEFINSGVTNVPL